MDVERIRILFNRFASEYEKHMQETNHITIQHELIAVFLPFLRGSVLDIATGTGTVAKYIREKSQCEIHAIDSSSEMIRLASKNSEGIEYRLADAHQLPYDNEKFDVILCSYGFYWFEDPEKVICEVKRVLKPNGVFILMEEEFKQGESPKPRFSERQGYLEELADLENYIGIADIKQKMEKNGLSLIEETRVPVDEIHDTIGMVYRKKATPYTSS